ncbi:MAG: 30S ribosomal protein S1 [Proteobacteria bacterium]|nr:30S ribosomal protein S1 [Pseudomonadota bacterium]MBU1710390.1 30S ribosomal protein S1 [Pseudomonadota bacterium]
MESFADLLEKNLGEEKPLEPGQKVEAEIVRIAKDWVFIDVGGKSEGSLAVSELLDKDGNISIKEGDVIEAYFLSSRKNEMLFTSKMGGLAAQAHLEDIFHNRIPVEGYVEKEIKGGFQVTIAGSTRAFCPFSQMDTRRVEKSDDYIGEKFLFRISEYKEKGRNIIVSRRVLLEEERRLKKEELRKVIKPGDVVSGTITSVRDFGAFVDIGGIEGLIPVSEIGWGRVEDIHGAVHAGQEVKVTVMNLDWENDKFSFSLKESLPDPFDAASGKYPEGTTHAGTVARLTNFGAFVTLEPGVDGLVHISKLGGGRKINHPREVLETGQVIDVRVESIDLENRRISLALEGVAREETDEKKAEKEYGNYIKQSTTEPPKSMGTLGDLLKAKLDSNK